jgi:hypothetical protein
MPIFNPIGFFNYTIDEKVYFKRGSGLFTGRMPLFGMLMNIIFLAKVL